ncbi:MAG: T9SS type A sorting domain-containing protein [Flavobacteriales bacterium]|nr:T9SS type A sorting domain-containing protein [Flavobacteriales bacterium]QQS72328.1 MAG: T9SS type A sorting domain-containing protein [Flavobacteriales bacterium]
MNTRYSFRNRPARQRWRTGLATLAAVGLLASVSAQNVTLYSFANSAGGSLDPMSGSTVLVGSGQDDAASAVTNIGFTFVYEGINYTQFSVSSNGCMRLGSTQVSAYSIYNLPNPGNEPAILPYSADGTTATGSISTTLVGSPPSQIRVIQWNVGTNYNDATANSTYQVWLYEGSNLMEFRYGVGENGFSDDLIAIGGAVSTNYVNIRPGPVASTTNPAGGGVWPGDGSVYTFSPPSPCTPPPAPGNTLASTTSGCPGVTSNLSIQNATSGSGVSYQWQSSPDGLAPWTNVGPATPTYTTGALLTTTWFRCEVTCSVGSSTVASTPVEITVSTPASSYQVFSGAQITEDFSSWGDRCSTTDVPSSANNYWTNSPAYGPGTWRRNDQGASAGWANTFGGFFTFENGAIAPTARFHSREGGSVVGNLDYHIDMSAGTGAELLRFEYINAYGNGTLEVLVSQNGGTSFTSLGAPLNNIGATAWVTKEYTIGSTSAQTVIRLKGTAGPYANGNDIGADNFRILPAPTCAKPLAVGATVTGAGTVDVDWTCSACTGTYIIEYGTTGFTPGTGATASGGTVVTSASSPATISGLANGNYEVYVRQDCGGNDYSENSAPAAFGIVDGDLCSNAIDIATLGLPVMSDSYSTLGTTVGANPNYSSSACFASLTGKDIVLFHDVEPGATLTLGPWCSGYKVSIAYGGSCPGNICLASASGGGYLDAGPNVIPYGPWDDAIFSWTNTNCNTERVYLLATHNTTGAIFEAEYYSYTPASGPFCATISGVAVSTVNTGTNANMSWSASCSGNVIVEYGLAGFTPGTGATANGGTVMAVSGTSTSLSGLSMDVPYDVYVRNDCGSGNYGPNGTASTFTIFNGDDCSRVIALSGTTGALGINTTGTNDDISVCSAGNTGGDLIMSYVVEPGYGIYFASTPVGPYLGQVRIAYGISCPGANELYCAAGATDYLWMNGTGVEQTVYFIQDGADEGATTVEWTYFTCTGNQVVVAINTDYNPTETTWEITDASNAVIASGGPTAAQEHMLVSETVCLGAAPENTCYGFRLMDGYGDGINNGNWQLKSTSGRVLLGDDFANGFDSPSLTPAYAGYAEHSFCLPVGNSHTAAKSCGIFDFTMNSKVYCNNAPGATSYQFEFSDPDAGFIRRIAVPTNWVRFNQMQTSPLTPGVKYFVRVRNDGSGSLASAHFGGGCEVGLGSSLPCTELISAPTYGHSCGEERAFNTNNSFIYATPVVGATEYQFRIFIPSEGYDETFIRSTYILQLKWNNRPPMVNGSTYSVQVNVKVGATYSGFCGQTCTITINNGNPRPEASMAQATGTATMWPNPVRESQVNLSIDGIQDADQNITVDIQDIYGKQVFAKEFGNSGERFTTILDLPSDIASGVYMVNITVNGQKTVQRLSIIR